MPTLDGNEAISELDQRRQIVASWIQSNIRPTAVILKEAEISEVPFEEEILEEATNFEVREYQLDAWGKLWDARQAGRKSGLIHLATGLGKTSVAVFDVMKFRKEFYAGHGRYPRVLFTSHKLEINEQAAERFEAFVPEATRGFYDGNKKDTEADITFATLQSLHKNLKAFKRDDFDHIVYDEAHHSQAETFKQVVKYFRPAFKLALTATPDRMDEADIRELFGRELYSKTLAEALAEGWLAQPDYHIVFDDAVKEAMRSGFEAKSLRALAELFNVQPRNETIAKNIREEMARIGLELGGVKTIVFCQNITHAEEMAELLGGRAYHSEVSKEKRRDTLTDFKYGGLQVICTRDMFNEGLDIPDARLLVFLRSTSSQTVFEQQLGRGLRKHAGKDRVSVLDFVANVERIAMIQELAKAIKNSTSSTNSTAGSGVNEIAVDGPGAFGKGESGIAIHAVNGEFDFEKLAIDLVNQYYALVESNHAEAPAADEILLQEIASSVGMTNLALSRIVDRHGIETAIRRIDESGVGMLYIKESVLEKILSLPEINMLPIQDDEVPLNVVTKQLGTDNGVIRRTLESEGIEYLMRRGDKNMPTRCIREEDAQRIYNIPKFNIPKAEDNDISLGDYVQSVLPGYKRIISLLRMHGLEPVVRRKGSANPSLFLTAEMKELLDEDVARSNDEEKLGPFASSLGTTREKLLKLAEKHGIPIREEQTISGRSDLFVSADSRNKIKALPEFGLQLPQEGETPVHAAALPRRMKPKRLHTIIDEIGITTQQRRTRNGKVSSYLSESDLMAIDNYLATKAKGSHDA